MTSIKHLICALVLAVSLVGLAAADTAPVNINTATAEQISTALNGVGPSKAQAIVDYRELHGAFTDIDELVNVRGIGLATVERNRDRIVLGNNDQQ